MNFPPVSAVAEIELLIRRPPADVFAAFTEPELLTQFWLARANTRLRMNTRARWEFRVEGASAEVAVLDLKPNQRLLTEWDDGTTVEWRFEPVELDATLLRIRQSGFKGSPDEIVAAALDATQGFTLVVCELKALLGLRASLGAVQDKADLIQRARRRAPVA